MIPLFGRGTLMVSILQKQGSNSAKTATQTLQTHFGSFFGLSTSRQNSYSSPRNCFIKQFQWVTFWQNIILATTTFARPYVTHLKLLSMSFSDAPKLVLFGGALLVSDLNGHPLMASLHGWCEPCKDLPMIISSQ